jgi:hypothetical protein
MTTDGERDVFEGWAILELLGHRRLCGYVTEVEAFGGKMGRIDVPSNPPSSHLFHGSTVYCMTPTTEEIARALTDRDQPAPVSRWELPAKVGGTSDVPLPRRYDSAEDDEPF